MHAYIHRYIHIACMHNDFHTLPGSRDVGSITSVGIVTVLSPRNKSGGIDFRYANSNGWKQPNTPASFNRIVEKFSSTETERNLYNIFYNYITITRIVHKMFV